MTDDKTKESQLPTWAAGLIVFAMGVLFILLDKLAGVTFLTPQAVVVCLVGGSLIINDLTRGSLYRTMFKNTGLMISVLGVCFVLLDAFFVVPSFLTPTGVVLSGFGGVMTMMEFGMNPFGILRPLSRIIPFKRLYSILFAGIVLLFYLFGEEMFGLITRYLPYVLAFMVIVCTCIPLRELAREDITENEKKDAKIFIGLSIVLVIVMLYIFSHWWSEWL